MTSPARDQEKRFLEMSAEEAVETRKLLLDQLWGYIKKYKKDVDPLAVKLSRCDDGRWMLLMPARKSTERERREAPTWEDMRDQEARTVDVTDWAEEIARPILARNDQRARKLGFKQMTLLCRAGMTDDEFVTWAENVLAVLLCAKS